MIEIISLFDESGFMLQPWAEAGYNCAAFDIKNKGNVEHFSSGGSITYFYADLSSLEVLDKIVALQPKIVFGFPPCTDLAGSGSKHFEKKAEKNIQFQQEALQLARAVEYVGDRAECEWMAENPIGSLSSLWRKPNEIFDPCDFGGYLPEDDLHPRYPEYISPRDAYKKKTCIWHSKYFRFPVELPVMPEKFGNLGVSKQTQKLGGKSEKTKTIRSATPRGFARAVFLANKDLL